MSPGRVAIADQRHVQKVVLLPDIRHSRADVGVEVVPLQAELLGCHGGVVLRVVCLPPLEHSLPTLR